MSAERSIVCSLARYPRSSSQYGGEMVLSFGGPVPESDVRTVRRSCGPLTIQLLAPRRRPIASSRRA